MDTKRGAASAPTQAPDTRHDNAKQRWSMAVSTRTKARAAEAATIDAVRTAPPTIARTFVSSTHIPGIPRWCQTTHSTPSSALLELRRCTKIPGTHPASAERLGGGNAGEPVAELLTHRRRCRAVIALTYLRLHPRDRSLSDQRAVTARAGGTHNWDHHRPATTGDAAGVWARGENRAVEHEATVGVEAATAGWTFSTATATVAERRPRVPVEITTGDQGPEWKTHVAIGFLNSQTWTVIGGCCAIAGASTHVARSIKCTESPKLLTVRT